MELLTDNGAVNAIDNNYNQNRTPIDGSPISTNTRKEMPLQQEQGTESLSYRLGKRFAKFAGIQGQQVFVEQKPGINIDPQVQTQNSNTAQEANNGRRKFVFEELLPTITLPWWLKFLAPAGLISCGSEKFNPLERRKSLKAPPPSKICTRIDLYEKIDRIPGNNGVIAQTPSTQSASVFVPHDTKKNNKIEIMPGAYSSQERVQLVLDYKNGIISSGILLKLKVFDKNGNVVPGKYDKVYIEDGSNLEVYEKDESGNKKPINLDFAFGVADDVVYEPMNGPSGGEYLGTCHFQGKDHYFIYTPINDFLDEGSSSLHIYTSNPRKAKKPGEGELVLELERDEISKSMVEDIKKKCKK